MGWSQNLQVLANQVVIFGPGQGLFVYNGTPAAGNLIGSIAETTTADPYGNAVLQGITSYDPASFSAAQLQGGICNFLTAASQAGPYTSQGYATASANALEVFGGNSALTQGQIIVGPVPHATGLTGGVVSTTSLAPQTMSALTTGSVSSSAAETVIGQFQIPAADPQVGTGYRFRVFGTADSNGTGPPTLDLKMRLGPNGTTGDTLIYTYATITERAGASANLGWTLDGWFYFTAVGASPRISGSALQSQQLTTGADSPPNWAFANNLNPGASTNSLFLSVTATWGTSSSANIARTVIGSMERLCY